ncbi:hypothetical protein OHT53_17290 [Streptomyces bobili]|uniref:Uncharacterized protein n=1 Tax=Streptomyces bobili TaxID=67280 RepID=A0ABZ1QZ46_9ACTN|nr:MULTISPECIES: hypothetical protein [Streptomyces]
MAHTFEELVAKQRAVDEAHARVLHLRDTYGAPTAAPWSQAQTDTYETAWRAWRDLARDTQAALSEYAKDESRPRNAVEADVRRAAKTPPEAPGWGSETGTGSGSRPASGSTSEEPPSGGR